VHVFSVLIAQDDVPSRVVKALFPLAVSCQTSVSDVPSKRHCLRFLQRLFMYCEDIPDIKRARMNRCLYEILTDPHSSTVYPDAIDTLRVQLYHHPENWMLAHKIVRLAVAFLKSCDDRLLESLYDFFGLIFINPDLPIEDWGERLPYGSIVQNIDCINLKVAKSCALLLIDMTARNELFIGALIENGLFQILSQNYDRPLPMKKKVTEITENILLVGEPAQCMQTLDCDFFARQMAELDMLATRDQMRFLRALRIAVEKSKPMGWFEDVRELFNKATVFDALLELHGRDCKPVSEVAENILLEFGDFNEDN
jgi:hypothetical protein